MARTSYVPSMQHLTQGDTVDTDDKDYKTLPNGELLKWFKNARDTGALCGGHHKASVNERLAKQYADEIHARGLEVPPWADSGTFNGPGAY